MKQALWWIKRDFRLLDNEALNVALQRADNILPLYVFERDYIAQPDISPMHIWAWLRALKDLKANCQSIHGDVLISKGHILKILTNLHQKWNFSAIYSHEETGNYWTYQRDLTVAKWCKDNGVQWIEIPQNAVIRRLKNRDQRQHLIKERLFESSVIPKPSQLKFPDNFKKLCAQRPLPQLHELCDTTNYPDIQWDALQEVSESSAHQTLKSFLTQRGQWYSGGISSPNKAMTCGSRLSVHLAWGTISLRHVFQQTYQRATDTQFFQSSSDTKRWSKSLRAFASRLHWHCHFIQRLESESRMEFAALNHAYTTLKYENHLDKLKAWEGGKTGFPMIDACMRCLNATGFINFRMRSMLVSFACFGLHLDWRLIHPHLAQVFLDYEPGIHLSQLQMQAGIVGINTIRVYSPTKQIIDQDPECVFIKKWIPELRPFSPQQILCYESIILGDYPPSIVDFKTSSKIMKDRVFKIRKSIDGKKESQKVLKTHGSRKRSQKKKVIEDNQLKLF